MLRTIVTALLVAASPALLAQSDPGKAPRKARFDCSQAKDPKACEERVAKVKAAHEKALKACEGQKSDQRRDCMRREMCAQSADPAKCEARAKEASAIRAKVREACKDKKGEELRACVREQREKAAKK
ncbi:MAG TPA: hypothetical protein VF110_16800 [Burkholderiales bacterium]|jgi:Spy/CpxP family protein refolding chaperone